MPTDYEKTYSETRHALGAPTREFISFFESLDVQGLRVLDVGCGQGRDALFIARLGHRVVGIDHAPSGIRDMLADAALEGLTVEGLVADIRYLSIDGDFDVLLIDRTLHMLNVDERTAVLSRLLNVVSASGYVLIADEKSNIPAFEKVLREHRRAWEGVLKRRGFLFVRQGERLGN